MNNQTSKDHARAPLCATSEFTIHLDPQKKHVRSEKESAPFLAEKEIEQQLHARASRVEDELLAAFHAIRKFPKSVTFFGSARFEPKHPDYQRAKRISARICKEGYAVITGGGPGIMAAGNEGSKMSCEHAVGFNIELPYEQVINEHVTHGLNFYYFFTRKVALAFSAEAYLFFPGGYGTLDEFYEITTLIQTEKIPRVPVVCVGAAFWNHVHEMNKELLRDEYATISPGDLDIYHITDDEDEILEIVKEAPIRNEYE